MSLTLSRAHDVAPLAAISLLFPARYRCRRTLRHLRGRARADALMNINDASSRRLTDWMKGRDAGEWALTKTDFTLAKSRTMNIHEITRRDASGRLLSNVG